ncbi:hypothetical protein C0Q44_10075 [Paenibacillus sp. PCH8]|uniref:hypothetical protein n=1 Tax=Paenibacillus sp. PCH8 TaxID=2066524 RepID=UPI000CF9CCFB|nr:hypothetical protein [Paenibacillus sp. PCH8]PQP84847.1 hypothetical protein C0Q44_10075 [Paenibacillus sp. PCH8]
MEPITVLSDGKRRIAYENMIQLLREWIAEAPAGLSSETDRGGWENSRFCIVDYQVAEEAVSAANAIRAFMPQIPLLVITDFKSLIRKRHLQQITGTGEMKMILWNEQDPDHLIKDMEQYLHSSLYPTQIATSPILSMR